MDALSLFVGAEQRRRAVHLDGLQLAPARVRGVVQDLQVAHAHLMLQAAGNISITVVPRCIHGQLHRQATQCFSQHGAAVREGSVRPGREVVHRSTTKQAALLRRAWPTLHRQLVASPEAVGSLKMGHSAARDQGK